MAPFIHVAWGATEYTDSFYTTASTDTVTFSSSSFLDNDYLYLQAAGYWTAYLIPSVAIENGATITKAELVIVSSNVSIASPTDSIDIAAELADNPSAVSSYSDGMTRKENLGTAVECAFNAEITGSNDNPYRFGDIKNVIQGIVDRAGWESGNNIMLMSIVHQTDVGGRQAHSYYTGNSSGYEPHLYVEWTA